MKPTAGLFLILCMILSGSPLLAQEAYTLKEDLAYYPAENQAADDYLKERCRLDFYYPEKAKGFATVIWFHGGGLKQGSKSIPKELKEQGIAVASVNYRLSPKAKVTDCIEDAAAATAWVLQNVAEHGGSADSVFISGHSAGGYLALMVGLDDKYLKRWELSPDRLAGLIPFSGHTITHFTARAEKGIPGHQPVIDGLAPLFHVKKEAPPILLITGDRELEMLGRYEENAYFARMMKVAGHDSTRLLELDGYGHNMAKPAYPLLLKEVRRIEAKKEE